MPDKNQPNVWQFIAVTYDGTNAIYYINGVQNIQSAPYGNIYSVAANWCIGCEDYWVHHDFASASFFNGSISDVQIYNVSLDTNQIRALYLKGIGAAPVDPNHIIGWWPLNGDVNDYSGNNNNGATGNAIYTSAWLSGYTAP